METLRGKILGCLKAYNDEDKRLIEGLEQIIHESGPDAYLVIFEVITQMQLDPEKAKILWHQVIGHQRGMEALLQRDVGLRTSLCDYMCSVSRILKNPMVLEIEAFERCLQSYMHDYLTGLHSRGFLETILDRELARCKRHDNELSLLFLDIDDFKTVNDQYGHVAGDKCLAKVAHIIKDSIRTEDTAVRYGGEEIVVIFPQTSKEDALAIAERIRTQISMTEFGNQNHPYQVTVSGGLVTFPMDGRDCAQLLERADAAMYQAKGAGKNTIVVYSHEKRRCLRVDFDRHVEAKPVEFLNKPVSMDVQGKNISSGGMLFEAASFFSIGSKVQLRMLLVPPGDHIEVTGVVVRNKLNRRGRFETGISFLDIDKPVQKAIHDYLRIG